MNGAYFFKIISLIFFSFWHCFCHFSNFGANFLGLLGYMRGHVIVFLSVAVVLSIYYGYTEYNCDCDCDFSIHALTIKFIDGYWFLIPNPIRTELCYQHQIHPRAWPFIRALDCNCLLFI